MSSPFRQLPEGASYLPAFLHKFVELVAKAAHNFVHANDEQLFNMSKFWSGMRVCLYNTGRNEKKRGSFGASAGSDAKASEAEVPPSKRESEQDTEDEPMEDDEFFKFKRPGKENKGVAGNKNEQERNESEPETEVPNRTPTKPPASDSNEGKRKAEGPLGEATPGKMQRQQTLKSTKTRESVYDQLASAAALGQTVDEIVELLRARHAIWKDSRSRIYKKHCDVIAKIIVELCNASPKDSWKTIIEGHKPTLNKMPADFY